MSIPSHEAIRGWMQRVGLARMQQAPHEDGGTWLVDHTNQIGPEKVLTVLRVRSAPRAGVALRHEDVEVLATIPSRQSKREDVAREYQPLAERFGTPDAVVTDGAVELRESVAVLDTAEKQPRVFRDPKHFLANRLEALLKSDPDYAAFSQGVGQARSALQQTELAHFTPPPFKTKARFMNLQPLLAWAAAALWHLEHPESDSCPAASRSRLEDKLGWLRGCAESLARWTACQTVIATTLTFLNQQGLFAGVTTAYETLLAGLDETAGFVPCPASRQLAADMAALLRESEQQLRPGERLPLSTEILESSFALFKHQEGQHAKGGFTNLLLAFPTLLRETTAAEVVTSFAAVKVAEVKAWTKRHLPRSLTSRRQGLYREVKASQTTKPHNRATNLSKANSSF